MSKIDLKTVHKALFAAPRGRFVEISVPQLAYIMVDGSGDPNTSAEYTAALGWLYPVAYAIKFAYKARGSDFVVAPLEGLWWADDPASFTSRRKDEWKWTMMLMMPDFVSEDDFRTALHKVTLKQGDPPLSLRLQYLAEGRCLQALHVGSYDDEGPLLAELHDGIMPRMKLTFAGPHHEIYLGDPRKTAPEKLKTLLRQPVRGI